MRDRQLKERYRSNKIRNALNDIEKEINLIYCDNEEYDESEKKRLLNELLGFAEREYELEKSDEDWVTVKNIKKVFEVKE